MRQLWSPATAREPAELDDSALRAAYAYPDTARPWIRVNFVSSADGSVTLDGRSRGLSSTADQRLFRVLRELADVVLAGAGTVRTENYRGARSSPAARSRRAARGQQPVPPIGVITGSCQLDPASGLFTDTETAPIIFTTEQASRTVNAQRLVDAGGILDVVGATHVEPVGLVAALEKRGLYHVLCEGGPHLFGELLAGDAVDELCLTVSPQLVGGYAGRIVAGPVPARDRRYHLAGVLVDDDELLLRYVRVTDPASTSARS